MEQTDVIELLDGLYSMIAEAWGVPLGNDKCIIEREKALDIINEIKAAMPSSLAEAKRLVAARDEFIGNAKKEAEALGDDPDSPHGRADGQRREEAGGGPCGRQLRKVRPRTARRGREQLHHPAVSVQVSDRKGRPSGRPFRSFAIRFRSAFSGPKNIAFSVQMLYNMRACGHLLRENIKSGRRRKK